MSDADQITEDEINDVIAAHELPDDVRTLLVRLGEMTGELSAELEDVRAERDELQRELDGDSEAFDVLRAVRDWMHDVMFLGKPMRDPRRILRLVERALEP